MEEEPHESLVLHGKGGRRKHIFSFSLFLTSSSVGWRILPGPSRRLLKYWSIQPGNGLLSGISSFFVLDLIPSCLGPCGIISAADAFLVNLQLDNPSQTSHLLLLWTPDLLSQVGKKVRTCGWKPQTKKTSVRKLNTCKPLTNRAKHQGMMSLS